MRQVELPVVPHDAPLTTALAAMYASDRLAVVTVSGGKVRLIRALQLQRAVKEGKKTLDEVEETKIVVAPFAKPKLHVEDGIKWCTTESPFRVHMGVPMAVPSVAEYDVDLRFGPLLSDQKPFALGSLSIGRAVIITSHEDRGEALFGAPTGCYCTDPQYQHKASRGDTSCRFDGSSVECT